MSPKTLVTSSPCLNIRVCVSEAFCIITFACNFFSKNFQKKRYIPIQEKKHDINMESRELTGSWVGIVCGEQTVFEFTSGRMMVLTRKGCDVVCTYKVEGDELSIAETGGATSVYKIAAYTDTNLELEAGGEVTHLCPLGAADITQDASQESLGMEVDLALVGTALPTSSKLLQ